MRRPLELLSLSIAGVLLSGCVDRLLLADAVETGSTSTTEPPVDDGDEPIDDDEPVDDDSGRDTEFPADLGTLPPECIDTIIEPPGVPLVVMGTTVPGTSRLSPTCVSADAAEATVQFIAPQQGTYTFDTIGSNFDTILYVLSGECEGEVLACNDDAVGVQSSVSVSLAAGDAVTVVVDGFNDHGDWLLNIDGSFAGMCPDAQLDPDPFVQVEGVLDGSQNNSIDPSCASGGGDIVYQYVPPISGLYSLSTEGSDFDTVLAVFDATCTSELGCDDDGAGSVQSQLTMEFEAGVPVMIAVDSFSNDEGFFVLTVEAI